MDPRDTKAFASEMYPSMKDEVARDGSGPAAGAAADAAARGGPAAAAGSAAATPAEAERTSKQALAVELYPSMQPGGAPRALQDDPEAWASAARADREIGGQALRENLEYAGNVMKEFGTDELRSALDRYGWGNHPELIRVLSRAGRALREARGSSK